MAPKPKRHKIECIVCHKIFDSDYRHKHNDLLHSNMLKSNKSIPYKTFGAPQNPFVAAKLVSQSTPAPQPTSTAQSVPQSILPAQSTPAPLTTNFTCLLYTSPSPRDGLLSRMPSSA